MDAACGTGRHAARLAARGHRVVGVDTSPEMLDRAQINAPAADFHVGDLHELPADDGTFDVVVCALALAHLTDLAPVYAEFARVVRPGGHLVVSDVHAEAVLRGSQPAVRVDGRPARIRNYRHHAADHLQPALKHGFEVVGCIEPRVSALPTPQEPASAPGPWDTWPWSLGPMIPEAASAAAEGEPVMVIWHYRMPSA
nr:class I SAM-dependent methyltransferase [Pseudonocardia sp. HH130629-09]